MTAHILLASTFIRFLFAERASRSIHQLKCALREEGDITIEEEALDPAFSINVGNEDTEIVWHELQHSHAGK